MQNYNARFGRLKVKTLYFGGGTPSVLSAQHFEKLCDSIHHHFDLSECLEKTIEINPGQLTKDKLSAYKTFGISRASLGAQSFSDLSLDFLGRNHSYKTTLKTIDKLRDNGFRNLNLDWMVGLPHESSGDVTNNLSQLLGLAPEHVSIYGLTIKPGTPFYKNQIRPQEDDVVLKTLRKVRQRLTQSGYRQYELSNYAKQGYQSQHNLAYWRFEPVVGVGTGSHSFFMDRHYHHPKSLQSYLQSPFPKALQSVTFRKSPIKERMKSFFIATLRKDSGFLFSEFETYFQTSFHAQFSVVKERLTNAKLVKKSPIRFALTLKGWYLMDTILTELFNEIDYEHTF